MGRRVGFFMFVVVAGRNFQGANQVVTTLRLFTPFLWRAVGILFRGVFFTVGITMGKRSTSAYHFRGLNGNCVLGVLLFRWVGGDLYSALLSGYIWFLFSIRSVPLGYSAVVSHSASMSYLSYVADEILYR